MKRLHCYVILTQLIGASLSVVYNASDCNAPCLYGTYQQSPCKKSSPKICQGEFWLNFYLKIRLRRVNCFTNKIIKHHLVLQPQKYLNQLYLSVVQSANSSVNQANTSRRNAHLLKTQNARVGAYMDGQLFNSMVRYMQGRLNTSALRYNLVVQDTVISPTKLTIILKQN